MISAAKLSNYLQSAKRISFFLYFDLIYLRRCLNDTIFPIFPTLSIKQFVIFRAKNKKNGIFSFVLLYFCVEIGEKSFIFSFFYDFFSSCPSFFVILARISRKRVHIHICSNSPVEFAPQQREKEQS